MNKLDAVVNVDDVVLSQDYTIHKNIVYFATPPLNNSAN